MAGSGQDRALRTGCLHKTTVITARRPESELKVKVSAGCLLPGTLGETVQASPLVSGGLLVIFGVRCPVDSSPQSVSTFVWLLPVWASVPKFPLYVAASCVG